MLALASFGFGKNQVTDECTEKYCRIYQQKMGCVFSIHFAILTIFPHESRPYQIRPVAHFWVATHQLRTPSVNIPGVALQLLRQRACVHFSIYGSNSDSLRCSTEDSGMSLFSMWKGRLMKANTPVEYNSLSPAFFIQAMWHYLNGQGSLETGQN